MDKRITTFLNNCLYRVYAPVAYRVEKYRATRMWHDGVRQCVKMYKEIGSPRVYLFFDAKHMVWSPMTYEENKKYKPSLRVLRRMGKLRGSNLPTNVEDMKAKSFYYTPSKWGARGCYEDNELRARKLKQWVAYYLTHLSPVMLKLRHYRSALAKPLHPSTAECD